MILTLFDESYFDRIFDASESLMNSNAFTIGIVSDDKAFRSPPISIAIEINVIDREVRQKTRNSFFLLKTIHRGSVLSHE